MVYKYNYIFNIFLGIRLYFAKLIKGLNEQTSAKAQLGLGHSYSRCKVKFNVHRVDNMIIQSIALLDQLDKDVNTFSMRIRLILIIYINLEYFFNIYIYIYMLTDNNMLNIDLITIMSKSNI